MESSFCLHFADGVRCRDLATLKTVEDFVPRWRGVGLNKLQTVRDLGQSSLYSGITYAENLLHFFNRSVAPHERDDEHLILKRKPGELRQFELPFDRDAALRHPHSLDQDRL